MIETRNNPKMRNPEFSMVCIAMHMHLFGLMGILIYGIYVENKESNDNTENGCTKVAKATKKHNAKSMQSNRKLFFWF